ncbi:MAG: organomercurial lyase [Candidatus Limnocylindrales bacterium]
MRSCHSSRPTRPSTTTSGRTFCHYVLYFATADAAAQWVAEHPGTFWLPVADAFEVARRTNAAVFPDLVGTDVR